MQTDSISDGVMIKTLLQNALFDKGKIPSDIAHFFESAECGECYVCHILAVMEEVWRVVRDDGTLWLNLGDTWATGAGKVGQCPGGGTRGEKFRAHFGKHTPGSTLAMEGLTQPNRMPIPGYKAKQLIGIPWKVAFALGSVGWILRCDVVWEKTNSMMQSAKDRPTRNHEYIFLFSKKRHYYYDSDAIAEPQCESERRRRLLEQNEGLKTVYPLKRDELLGQPQQSRAGAARSSEARQRLAIKGTKIRRSVWRFATGIGAGMGHYAIFPRDLPERCIKAGSRQGDVVLDPFCGSGTTCLVAQDLGRIGIGLDLTYQDIAAQRIGGSLFRGVVNSAWS